MRLGPVMLDVAGHALGPGDLERLAHPQVGGVILFARNYASPAQLVSLVRAIRAVRSPELLIAVDHEGGRVQRFRQGFSAIPPMRELGRAWDKDAAHGLAAARACGYVIGAELQAHGIDLTFAPVLDIDHGNSSVIGDRSFHADPGVVAVLGEAVHAGLHASGMASVGKHFPGHGFVKADSHHEVPVDDRPLAEIAKSDLVPFQRLARAGMAGVMPAHVVYTKVDAKPAGFSSVWLQDVLRRELGFDGLVFSDDLSMEGASGAGGIAARANAALAAGCDMVLVCNDPRSADILLEALERRPIAASLARRIERLRGRAITGAGLKASAAYLAASESLARVRA